MLKYTNSDRCKTRVGKAVAKYLNKILRGKSERLSWAQAREKAEGNSLRPQG